MADMPLMDALDTAIDLILRDKRIPESDKDAAISRVMREIGDGRG